MGVLHHWHPLCCTGDAVHPGWLASIELSAISYQIVLQVRLSCNQDRESLVGQLWTTFHDSCRSSVKGLEKLEHSLAMKYASCTCKKCYNDPIHNGHDLLSWKVVQTPHTLLPILWESGLQDCTESDTNAAPLQSKLEWSMQLGMLYRKCACAEKASDLCNQIAS